MNGSGNASEPIDDDRGASILGPRNAAIESANPDALIAPETDAGTGDEPLVFLALFRSDHYADISLAQWMGMLPPELAKAHLNVDDEFIAALPTNEPLVR